MLLGLAVPVTASFIISFVVIGPALQQVGVEPFAAAMFIFYYAVLSEVSPPTAMSPFAAAAITGGKPVKTMWLTWKYTLPAFLVPFIFVLSERGVGPAARGHVDQVAIAFVTSVFAVTRAGRRHRVLAVRPGQDPGAAAVPRRRDRAAGDGAAVDRDRRAAFMAAGVVVHLIGLKKGRAGPRRRRTATGTRFPRPPPPPPPPGRPARPRTTAHRDDRSGDGSPAAGECVHRATRVAEWRPEHRWARS